MRTPCPLFWTCWDYFGALEELECVIHTRFIFSSGLQRVIISGLPWIMMAILDENGPLGMLVTLRMWYTLTVLESLWVSTASHPYIAAFSTTLSSPPPCAPASLPLCPIPPPSPYLSASRLPQPPSSILHILHSLYRPPLQPPILQIRERWLSGVVPQPWA